MKADVVIKKLQLIVSDLKEKFEAERDVTQLLRHKKNPKESSQLGKVIMFFANILKKIKQLKNLEKDFVDHKKMAAYEMQERVYRLLLLHYKSQFYAINGKLQEAYYICQTLIEELAKAEEYYKANSGVVSGAKDKFFDEAMALGAKARKFKCLIHCVQAMRERKKEKTATEGEKRDPKARRAVKYKDALKLAEEEAVERVRLNAWMAELDKAPKDLIVPKGSSRGARKYPRLAEELNMPSDPKKLRVVDLIPPLKSLHVKPYLHDVAGSMIGFPDLEAAIKDIKSKKGGLMSKIKWLFGR